MNKIIKFRKKNPAYSISKRPIRKVKSNVVFQGDNLEIMRELEPDKIDLIYIDPPFCSQSVQTSKAWGKKVISFPDEWGGGIQSYIRWLIPRLRECHRLLKETGVFCLHLDYKACHYAKIELDKIFGFNNFVNQVIWDYKKVSNSKAKKFLRSHDVILIYSKTRHYYFNRLFESVLSARKKQLIKQGYNTKNMNGEKYLYIYDKKNVENRIRKGQIKKTKYDHIVEVDITKGNAITDIFRIDFLNSNSKEKLGYPTQKPIILLDRLIKAFTNKGDMVFDSFCGCGTTISSAQSLGRKWLGIDISKDAISVIRKRMLKEHGLNIEVVKANSLSRSSIYQLNPFDFEHQLVKMLGGTPNLKKGGDGGVDGYCYDHTPIQVKKSFAVGRPVVDSFYKHVKNGNGRGVVIARSFSKGAYEEVARLYNKEGLQIDLIPSDDIIRDVA